MEVIADARGVSAPQLRMHRHRAEQRLVAAIRDGHLSGAVLGATPARDRACQARRDGVTIPPDQAHLTPTTSARPGEESVA